MTRVAMFLAIALTALASAPSPATAQRFDGYTDEGGYSFAMPTDQFTLMDTFPAGTTAIVDGYRLEGRNLAAVGDGIYLQKNTGSSSWLRVATTPVSMDPSFLEISPDGSTIAIGTGWYKPLIFVAAEDLSVGAPIDLATWPAAKLVDANYYDAAWLDDRYLLINAGDFATSWVYAVDRHAPDPALTFVDLVTGIPGASASVVVDPNGNVVTGNGYGFAGDTGDLRAYSAASISAALSSGTAIEWSAGTLIGKNVLSAAHMVFDAEGNLLVAGGDVFGGSGDAGYVAVIDAAAYERALAGGAPVDRDDPNELRRIVPSTCGAGGYSSVYYVESTDMLVGTCTYGSPNGLEVFLPPTAPDSDGDGIPDAVDNASWYPNPDQADADGDGVGDAGENTVYGPDEFEAFLDAFGATTTDPNYDRALDLNGSGTIDWADHQILLARWALRAPF